MAGVVNRVRAPRQQAKPSLSAPAEPKVLEITPPSSRPAVPAVTAAARRINLTTRDGKKLLEKCSQKWQDEAWAYFGVLPEVAFGAGFQANAMSRVRWFPAVLPSDDEPPVPLEDAVGEVDGITTELAAAAREELARLSTGSDGLPGLKHAFGVNLSIAGEAYLVGRDADDDDDLDDEIWGVYSSAAFKVKGRKVTLQGSPNGRQTELPDDTSFARIWRRDPQWPDLPWSNMRASLDTAEELLLHSRRLRAIAKSGTNAGALKVPSEIDPPTRPRADDQGDTDPDAVGQGEELTEFERDFVDWAISAVEDDGSAAQVAPWLLRAAYQHIDRIEWIDFARSIDEKIVERIDHLIERLAHGLDLPVEILKGVAAANHWCMDEQSEVYSSRGWVGVDDIRIGDTVLSMDHETGLSSWQPVTDLYVADVEDEPMLSIEGRYHSSLTTLNHRWPVLRRRGADLHWEREWMQSRGVAEMADACTSDYSIHHLSLVRSTPFGDLPTEPKWSDALVELVSWFWTEGSYRVRPGRDVAQVSIWQSHTANPGHCARIRRALTSLYGPPSADVMSGGWPQGSKHHSSKLTADQVAEIRERLASGDALAAIGRDFGVSGVAVGRIRDGKSWARGDATSTPQWREVQLADGKTEFRLNAAAAAPLVEIAPHRLVDPEFIDQLTQSQLLLFIDTAVRGDGYLMGGRTRIVGQKDPAMLDALERAAILAGFAVNRYEQTTTGFTVHVQHMLTMAEKPIYRPRSRGVTIQPYTGRVWCPSVPPHHTVFARRGGAPYWTGNTAWQISDDVYRVHVEPLDQIAARGVASTFLRPALLERGFPAEAVRKIMLGLDPSALVVRPNRAQDAKDAYDRLAISWDALRSALGFGDQDAPDEQERLERMALQRGPGSVTLTGHLLEETGLVDGLPADLGNDPTGGEPVPSGEQEPTEGGEPIPATLEAAEGFVARALEAARQNGNGHRSLTAARPVPDLGPALANIEPRLRERLTTAASRAVTAALRKAGNRLKGAAQGHPEVAERVRGQPAEEVGRILGAVVAVELADPDRLLEGAFDDLAGQWDMWVGQAQDQVASVLERHVETAADPEQALAALGQLRTAQESDRNAGWVVLAGLIVAHTTSLLFKGAEEMALGEHDPATVVHQGLIRQALARAGGGQPGLAPAGAAPQGGPGGLTTGPRVMEALAGFGMRATGWEWIVGLPERPFEPHQELSGIQFQSWDDERLATPGSFPDYPFLWPGDHSGCQCDAQPLVAVDAPAGQEVAA